MLAPLRTLETSLTEGVLTVRLNRPEVRNAFGTQTYLDLITAFKYAEDNSDVVVVVLTGNGPFFSSGADVKNSFSAEAQSSASVPMADQPVGQFMLRMLLFPKLIIAGVNGPAIGIGSTLLCHVDLVYACESAYFWTPFMRLALVPEFASSVLFERRFGTSVANELLLGSAKLSPRRMQIAGLVSEVFPDQAAMEQAILVFARNLTSQPLATKSVMLYKRMLKPQSYLQEMTQVIQQELHLLDQRKEEGDIVQAASEYFQQVAKQKTAATPKL